MLLPQRACSGAEMGVRREESRGVRLTVHTHTLPSGLPESSVQAARRLALSLGITLAFVLIEALAGVWANSLALLTDAIHNLTDVIALGLSWYAIRLAARPANSSRTFGYHRAGILVALLNSITLVVISIAIFYEAYQRLQAPPSVQAGILIVVALLALAVNGGTALLLKPGSEHDLNMRSAFIHLVADTISTLGAIVAGIAIVVTGLEWLDPLAGIFIGVLILWNAWGIVREAVDILLEGTPRDIDMERMLHELAQIQGVRGVHDLHVWSITHNMRALSAHVVTDNIRISEGAAIQNRINQVLLDHYGIAHATIQLECPGCDPDLLYCDLEHPNQLGDHDVMNK